MAVDLRCLYFNLLDGSDPVTDDTKYIDIDIVTLSVEPCLHLIGNNGSCSSDQYIGEGDLIYEVGLSSTGTDNLE